MNIIEMDNAYIANTYKRFPVEFVSGQGVTLVDAHGKKYIDLGSGIAVSAFGVCDAQWKQAVIDQLEKIQHTSNYYYTAPQARLAQMLCERTGMKKVFFGNSGAEANECAIKAARKYAADHKGPCLLYTSIARRPAHCQDSNSRSFVKKAIFCTKTTRFFRQILSLSLIHI